MYCKDCGSYMVIPVTHFERNKNPTRYQKCEKCQVKTKECINSFSEVLIRIQKLSKQSKKEDYE